MPENDFKQNYQLLRLIKRTTDNGNFYLVLVLFNNKYDSNLLRIYVKQDSFEKLIKLYNNKQYDITSYVTVEYKENFKDPNKSGFKPVIKI